MTLLENRITDPNRISREHLDEVLGRGVSPTIQFSKPGYSRRILKTVNKYCAEYGDRLEVRFFGHYSDAFDSSGVDRKQQEELRLIAFGKLR